MPAERRPGMDHDYYAWSPLPDRPQLQWPNGEPLALSVVVLLEYVELDPPAGSRTSATLAGGLGPRPHPNYALLSHREYGHRVGIFRVLDALANAGVPPTVAVDVRTAEEYPWLVGHCIDAGAEIVAHGLSVSQAITGEMNELSERAYISETLGRLERATGSRPTGWLGPEYGESARTPALLAAAGLQYVLDWCNDEQPYAMTVPEGRLTAVPTMVEYDDAFALWTRRMTPDSWAAMLETGADRLRRDGAMSARCLCFAVRPWLVGQPFRIGALERALAAITSPGDIWAATTGELAAAAATT